MFGNEFFPTPASIVQRMLSKISHDARYFLEPSAGKGDIAEGIKERFRYARVDCIEQSAELIAVLADKDFPIVGHDWLTYAGVCYYDAIIMNPPFSNGDEHLLRAWDFLYSGEIVCLLNEETLKNPYTERRQRLSRIIEEHGEAEFLGDCFSAGERKTGVGVALIYLKKTSDDDTISLWSNTSEEKQPAAETGMDKQMLALRDRLGNMQHYYDEANSHMLRAFQHVRKAALYMAANDIHVGSDYHEAVRLALDNVTHARAAFVRKHRHDAWLSVFTKMEFRKWLDRKQTDEFIRDIERNGNIPFTKENIKGTLENIFLQRTRLFEQSVANVFDALTRYYKGNTHHVEGWKTNDNYKVNEKIVFPYGCRFDAKFLGQFERLYYGGMIDIYHDLDRVLCVLSGEDFDRCYTVAQALERKFQILGHHVKSPFDNLTESQFFDIRFFKKGTVHLTFKDKKLLEEFNVTASRGKAWIGRDTQRAA